MKIYIYRIKTSSQKITFSSNVSNVKPRSGYINRDENTVDNMIKLVEYYLEHKHKINNYLNLEDILNLKSQ